MARPLILFDGSYMRLPKGVPLPDGAQIVPRLPEPGEVWNGTAFEQRPELTADIDVPAGHVDQAHLVKSIEAVLVLSGLVLTHGMIAEEAAATGQSVSDIAHAVHARTAAARATEAQRRKIKFGARTPSKEG